MFAKLLDLNVAKPDWWAHLFDFRNVAQPTERFLWRFCRAKCRWRYRQATWGLFGLCLDVSSAFDTRAAMGAAAFLFTGSKWVDHVWGARIGFHQG
jgi:hypothetical protein